MSEVYTFITTNQEILATWLNKETYTQDGYCVLENPRSVQPTREGQIMFIPLGFSVSDEGNFRMDNDKLYVHPKITDDAFSKPYLREFVEQSNLALPPEKKLILG